MDSYKSLRTAKKALENAKRLNIIARKTLHTSQKRFESMWDHNLNEDIRLLMQNTIWITSEISKINEKTLSNSKIAKQRAFARLNAVKKATQKASMYYAQSTKIIEQAHRTTYGAVEAIKKCKLAQGNKKKRNYTIAKQYILRANKELKLAKEMCKLAHKSSITARSAARLPLSKIPDV